MANELDTYSPGGLQPYSPDQPLAPVADDWGYEPDYLSDNTPAIQPDTSLQQQEQVLAQLEGVFLSDFLTLGHDRKFIDAAARLFRECLACEPQNVKKQHNYNCYQYASDPIFNHIANHLHRIGASQKFIENLAWWTAEIEKRLGIQVAGEQSPKAFSREQWEDSLSDAEYDEYIKRNETAKAKTESVLRQRWGSSYEQNRRATDAFLHNMPTNERAHFDQLTTGGIHALNTLEVVTRLYEMAIGSNSLPSGGALATEIATIEAVMKTNRKFYNSDLRMQARLRVLYDLRDR